MGGRRGVCSEYHCGPFRGVPPWCAAVRRLLLQRVVALLVWVLAVLVRIAAALVRRVLGLCRGASRNHL